MILFPKQTIHLTMVTTYGVAYGKHSGIVQKEVHLMDRTYFWHSKCLITNRYDASDRVKMFFFMFKLYSPNKTLFLQIISMIHLLV